MCLPVELKVLCQLLLTLAGFSTRAEAEAEAKSEADDAFWSFTQGRNNKQSAKELKGTEHIEERKKTPDEIERSIFTLLFRAISSKLDWARSLFQIVTTTEQLPSFNYLVSEPK